MASTTNEIWSPNLRRGEASRYLRKMHGLSVAPATLAKMFSQQSDGPPAYLAGRVPLYPLDELDAWAVKRLGRLRTSTSDKQAS
jgi:hypothetical protein